MARESAHAPPSRIEAVRFLADEAVPRPLAEEIVAHVSRRLVVPCLLESRPWSLDPVLLPGRDQVDADKLLAALESAPVPGTVRVGVTALDVGVTIFKFVFGRAACGGHAAVVSLARLTPEHYGLAADDNLLRRRAATEILHELGHVAGLNHCTDFNCIMHFAPNVESIDVRGAHFCSECAAALPGNFLSHVEA